MGPRSRVGSAGQGRVGRSNAVAQEYTFCRSNRLERAGRATPLGASISRRVFLSSIFTYTAEDNNNPNPNPKFLESMNMLCRASKLSTLPLVLAIGWSWYVHDSMHHVGNSPWGYHNKAATERLLVTGTRRATAQPSQSNGLRAQPSQSNGFRAQQSSRSNSLRALSAGFLPDMHMCGCAKTHSRHKNNFSGPNSRSLFYLVRKPARR